MREREGEEEGKGEGEKEGKREGEGEREGNIMSQLFELNYHIFSLIVASRN